MPTAAENSHAAAETHDVGLVPLVDEQEAGVIYDASIHRSAFVSGLLGLVLLGWFGYALASGLIAIEGLGQWAVGGPAVGAFTGGGVGAALGGLVGALVALYRIPARVERSPAS